MTSTPAPVAFPSEAYSFRSRRIFTKALVAVALVVLVIALLAIAVFAVIFAFASPFLYLLVLEEVYLFYQLHQ